MHVVFVVVVIVKATPPNPAPSTDLEPRLSRSRDGDHARLLRQVSVCLFFDIFNFVSDFVVFSYISEEHPFLCVMCNSKFTSKYGLHTHERSVHGIKPSTVCDFPGCGYAAPTPSELKKHQVKHM